MVTNKCWCSAQLHFRASFLFNIYIYIYIYINDLSKNLSSITKIFANDTSIFSVVHDVDLSAKQLNDDLNKISEWAFQCKMAFNPDLSKQAQKIDFSRKLVKLLYRAPVKNI